MIADKGAAAEVALRAAEAEIRKSTDEYSAVPALKESEGAAAPIISYTVFPDVRAATKTERGGSWPELVARVRGIPEYPRKEACPLVSMCSYGDKRSAQDSLRHQPNVLQVFGVEVDYDGERVSPEDAARLLQAADITALVYTSASHRPEAPRWRVLAPLSSPQPPARRAELVGRLNRVLGGIAGPESFKLSQAFYVGRVNGAPYEVFETLGHCIDQAAPVEPLIPETARNGEGRPTPPAVESDPVLREFVKCGLYLRELKPGAHAVTCPWASEHTTPDTDSGTAVFQPHFGGYPGYAFKCQHAHCTRRTIRDVLEFLGLQGGEASAFGLDPTAPLDTARRFIAEQHTHPEGRLLHYWRGDFYRWRGSCFVPLPPDEARAVLYAWLDARAGKPTKRAVDNVMDALRAAAFLDASPPCWLSEGETEGEVIACANGLVHVAGRELLPATPAFFNLNACGFDYQGEPQRPAAWLAFLGSLWAEDFEMVQTLQEVFGLLLTADTSHQKIILLIGPKRSGKGTIARVLRGLLGPENTSAPTLTGLGQNFGLAGLIGKPLAVISDARLSGRSDLATVVENLLRISGEDSVSVPRKFLSDWVGQLPTRFLMLTNELPALSDASGALASRFVILPLIRTFYDREDRALTGKLLAELPGIFAWALDGLDRLRARGHLLQPAAGAAALEALDRLASPIKAFAADCCTLDPAAEIACADLFDAWAAWCRDQHRDHPGTLPMFSRNLHAAFPTTATRQPRRDGGRLCRISRLGTG